MYPVKRRQLGIFKKICCRNVCAKHAFLNQTMCIISHHRHNLSDLPVCPENHPCFNGIEIHHTSALPAQPQAVKKRIECVERFSQAGVPLAQFVLEPQFGRGIRGLKHRRHIRICQSGM